MNRKELVLMAVICAVSGLVGGAISARLFPDAPAVAQGGSKAQAHVQAESFELVDPQGNTRAELALGSEGNPSLVLLDRDYKVRAKFALAGDGNPCLDLRDQERRCRAMLMLSGGGKPVLKLEEREQPPRSAD